MLFLRQDPTLGDLQNYVRELETERGFINDGIMQKCLLLFEEVGEFSELVDKPLQQHMIAGELADILIYLCSISNRLFMDLDEVCGIATGISLTQFQRNLGVQNVNLAVLDVCFVVALGRLCKVIRKLQGMKIDALSKEIKLKAALLDTILALCAAANNADVNLEQAFRDKEEINKTRTWTVTKNEARV